jgi:hypothetical protein
MQAGGKGYSLATGPNPEQGSDPMPQATSTLGARPNPFNTIESLANREIARRIVAQLRHSNSPDRYETTERLIAAAIDDAQVLGRIGSRR